MLKFSQYVITEKYENLFLKDEDKREEYVDKLWNMLEKTYEEIGGLKTKGFESKEDMINNIPFWKVIKSDGKVIGGLFYKEKNGRKRVATCIDGSDEAKRLLALAMKQEPVRGFFEVSKGSWGFIRKLFLPEDLLGFMVDVDKVKELNPNKKIYTLDEIPEEDLVEVGLDPDDPKNEPYKDYIYARELKGEKQPKVMIGTIGKNLIQK